MSHLPKKTLEDLEFYEVTEQIADLLTPMGKEFCENMEPLADKDTMLKELNTVSEYLGSLKMTTVFPVIVQTYPQLLSCSKLKIVY